MKLKLYWLGLFAVTVFALSPPLPTRTTVNGDCDTCQAELWSDACTVIIVGKNASVDGSVMTTHTCDCGVCDWTFRRIPAADWPAGSTRKIYPRRPVRRLRRPRSA